MCRIACLVIPPETMNAPGRVKHVDTVSARPSSTPRKVVRDVPAGVLPLKRQTLVDLTLEALRERILNGGYPEGEPLRQEAIAAELSVSRIPIREALRQLETEGLVVFNPHR